MFKNCLGIWKYQPCCTGQNQRDSVDLLNEGWSCIVNVSWRTGFTEEPTSLS